MWVAWISQILLGVPFGDRPAPDRFIWIFWIVFGIGLPAFFYFGYQEIQVTDEGITIRSMFLYTRHIQIEEVREVFVRNYDPLREYGGWGIRFGFQGQGRAYNVYGNQGVQLILKDDTRVLLGSQEPQALELAILNSMESD